VIDRPAFVAFVAGRPAPQGSKSFKGRTRAGKPRMVESSKYVKPWREEVRARLIDERGRPVIRFEGAVAVDLLFVLARPQRLKPGQQPAMTSTPDLDKLVRSTLDALTAAKVIVDDRYVTELGPVTKRYAFDHIEPTGCFIGLRSAELNPFEINDIPEDRSCP
jgi:Holliday junction resolvase RusA-like endonuclease